MLRRLRADIAERQHVRIFIENVSGYRFIDNFAKKTVHE